jgi:hypothetical protein
MSKRLVIKKKHKSKLSKEVSIYTVELSESDNGKPYLSVKGATGIPLSEKDAEKMYLWLKEYLYPY